MQIKTLVLFCLFFSSTTFAWNDHGRHTKVALQAFEKWEKTPFEKIEAVIPALTVGLNAKPLNRKDLADQLQIQSHKVAWDKNIGSNAYEVLINSADEPDSGMDQDMVLADYQDRMGGFKGLSSQGVRHMHFGPFRLASPIASLHIPPQRMGFAPERAEIFMTLAVQAKKSGHLYWAYRFLGWGVHYAQDLGQPYHNSQFQSFALIGRNKITQGFKAVVAETTRRVGNFHLSFEEFVDYLLTAGSGYENEARLMGAFQVAGPEAQKVLRPDASPTEIARSLRDFSEVGADLVSEVVQVQKQLLGDRLLDPEMDLISGFRDEAGKPKLHFEWILEDKKLADTRERFFMTMRKGISNTAAATRWFVERFRAY